MRQFARREFLIAAGALLAVPVTANAQRPTKLFHVGLLSIGTDPARPHRWQAFIDAMGELHYVEGRNLAIRRAFGHGRGERLSRLVADLVDAKVDVVVTTGTREIAAMKRATSSIPIVMTLAHDPVGQGFVPSLARPGGNVTGFTSLVPGLTQKYVELLKEVAPSVTRFAVVNMAPNPTPEIRRELAVAARALDVSLFVAQLSGPESFGKVLGQAKADGAGGIIHPLDGGTTPHRRLLVQAALTHRLPGIYWDREFVEEGGLMSYSASFADLLRQAATYVDRILRGAKPGDLPVQQPTKFYLVLNQQTAKALGVTVPQSILVRADHVIG